jgi:hypothetical protein
MWTPRRRRPSSWSCWKPRSWSPQVPSHMDQPIHAIAAWSGSSCCLCVPSISGHLHALDTGSSGVPPNTGSAS